MLTPLEIDKKEFKKTAFGYNPKEVDKFLSKILNDYETLYKDNIELQDKITVLNDGIQYYKTLEKTLQDTLISAEKSANEIKNAAYAKAETIEKEAELRAKQILDEAKDKLFEINSQITDLTKQYELTKREMTRILNSQLDILNRETSHLRAITKDSKIAIQDNNKDENVKVTVLK